MEINHNNQRHKGRKKSKMHKPGPLLLLSLHAEIAKIPSKCARESSIDSRFFTLSVKFMENFSKLLKVVLFKIDSFFR